jgi:hypothetical protein
MPATTMRRGPCGRHWSINSAKNNSALTQRGPLWIMNVTTWVRPLASSAPCGQSLWCHFETNRPGRIPLAADPLAVTSGRAAACHRKRPFLMATRF